MIYPYLVVRYMPAVYGRKKIRFCNYVPRVVAKDELVLLIDENPLGENRILKKEVIHLLLE